ncbi:sigma-70 family RNA polymerase sigma factor [Mesobacillus maritimus]|uniref:Sigma-70 family RNA polymerase sigma factor n=1 Tax=Mesobacillus maritimus TaxID=1643336 RepID=A0ABS7K6V7_9BACI|nr:sigma-70 family RNA polymerase sigma factor [Mesobacillus maritimus]MBY0097960.1 sigma-70 family RNA polymerase sigma factor [Mesobacillus maritimus]
MSTNEGTVNEKIVQVMDATTTSELEQLYRGLRRYCHFLAQNQWDGDDLVQEAMTKAIKHYSNTEITPSLLNKIAYHKWIDLIRKRKREVIGIEQEIASMETETAVEGLMDSVNSLINQLTAKQAVIFTLKEGFRFQLKEIADLLDSSEMAIKSTLFRARQTLARESKMQPVKPISEENEQILLYELIYRSLQTDDPQVLIDNLKDIPSLLEVPVQKKPTPTQTPLNFYSMAA